MICKEVCQKNNINCNSKECKYWIDYIKDQNCSLIAIDKNGSMKLREIAERLGLTITAVNQIEQRAKSKFLKILGS